MESKRLQQIKNYQKRLKSLLDDNIIDIILFGSFVKGGFAQDIDVALIAKNKENLTSIKTKINNFVKNADIQIITLENIHSSIWLTMIKEGFSVKKNKFLFELYDIKPVVLFKYSLKKLTNVQKVQFERGMKKIIKTEGTILTRSVVLVPITMKNEFIDFLKTWNIYYESQEYELLSLLRKEEFL